MGEVRSGDAAKLGRRIAPLSLPQGATQRYILFASVYLVLRSAPEGRNGACIHSPNSCAPLSETPPRRGRRRLARVHRPVTQGKCIRGEVYRGSHFCTSSFCSRCSRNLLCY